MCGPSRRLLRNPVLCGRIPGSLLAFFSNFLYFSNICLLPWKDVMMKLHEQFQNEKYVESTFSSLFTSVTLFQDCRKKWMCSLQRRTYYNPKQSLIMDIVLQSWSEEPESYVARGKRNPYGGGMDTSTTCVLFSNSLSVIFSKFVVRSVVAVFLDNIILSCTVLY